MLRLRLARLGASWTTPPPEPRLRTHSTCFTGPGRLTWTAERRPRRPGMARNGAPLAICPIRLDVAHHDKNFDQEDHAEEAAKEAVLTEGSQRQLWLQLAQAWLELAGSVSMAVRQGSRTIRDPPGTPGRCRRSNSGYRAARPRLAPERRWALHCALASRSQMADASATFSADFEVCAAPCGGGWPF